MGMWAPQSILRHSCCRKGGSKFQPLLLSQSAVSDFLIDFWIWIRIYHMRLKEIKNKLAVLFLLNLLGFQTVLSLGCLKAKGLRRLHVIPS